MSDEQRISHLEDEALERVKQAGDDGISPSKLIQQLAQQDFDEDLVRMAIWDLIDQQEVGLSRDWILSLRTA